MELGWLEPVALRELWPNEERDFSPWLARHIEHLGTALGIPLQDAECEVDVGAFRADITARTETGELVLIENYLGSSDHEHLGKLLTYLSYLDAKIAVWVVADVRPEHQKAVQWLNDQTPDDVSIYLVKLAAYRIEHSAPAPQFLVVAGPDAVGKASRRAEGEQALRHVLRRRFWEALLTRAKDRLPAFAHVSPTAENALSAGAGRAGVSWTFRVWLHERTAVELRIATVDRETNQRIFEELYRHRTAIEEAFGAPLEWDREEDKASCAIRVELREGGIGEGEASWTKIQDAMIDAMVKLRGILEPYLASLRRP